MSKNKAVFLFGIHNHQPVGNFGFVLEYAYEKSYLPFLQIMERFPDVKFALHCSGCLWDWILTHKPEYIERIRKLVDRGQVEMISGGYYEPILPVIPDRDKAAQLKKFNIFIQNTFGVKPKGMWLAERIWEPHLVKFIADAGLEYTFLDDYHFICAGLNYPVLDGYYVTEDQGYKLNVFPISQKLRYIVPFSGTPQKVVDYIRDNADESGKKAFILADDGEKFGVWPETYKHVYTDGWLEKFAVSLTENKSWLPTINYSEYLSKYPPLGRVYIPTGSYFEMSEWSLPSDVQLQFKEVMTQLDEKKEENIVLKRFVKGGIWRNFMTKYSESNNMNKHALLLSNKLWKYQEQHPDKTGDIEFIKAQDALLSSQCNCSYWHGVFGGLYLPHLRSAVYRDMIMAENIVDYMNGTLNSSYAESIDYNMDGMNETIISSEKIKLFIVPHVGGTLAEIDYRPKNVNLTNVLTRRKEAYHKKLVEYIENRSKNSIHGQVQTIHDLVKVKEDGLEDYLFYDWYPRVSLIDHFLHPESTIQDFRKSKYGEQGDFVNQPYKLNIMKNDVTEVKCELFRKGYVWVGPEHIELEVRKVITQKSGDAGFEVKYELTPRVVKPVRMCFSTEFNFGDFVRDGKDEAKVTNSVISWDKVDTVNNLAIEFIFDEKADIWQVPLETVSLSEGGFERVKQGVTIMPIWKIEILPGMSWTLKIVVKIKEL
ncbi:MAG: alpha-amylase/4-alpha-glucanotransferase domain-containing protein [Elusimicrobiota bacterium]